MAVSSSDATSAGTSSSAPSTTEHAPSVGSTGTGAAGPGSLANGGGTSGHGSSSPDVESYAARLRDGSADFKAKLTAANELKDLIEVLTSERIYARFLEALLPVCMELLSSVPCAFYSDKAEHRLRHTILDILHRLPHNDALRPHAPALMKLMLTILQTDNEENAVVALKVVIDLHRSYKQVLEDQVQPFLELVQTLYKNMETTVNEGFKAEDEASATSEQQPANPMSPAVDTAGAGAADAPRKLARSQYSFKVLTECPIAIVLIFQTYRTVVPQAIQVFVPLIVEFLRLQAPPQAEAHREAAEKGVVFVGVAPGIKKRSLFTELIVAQVKTMSFLAYVLRGSASGLRNYLTTIPEVSIRLLKDCPPEASATRKELLVATRHILSTEFRTHFIPQIDTLLDERVLIGTGLTAHETLRPLACSMLADLAHHTRNELPQPQLIRIAHTYACILHDPSLAPSIQTMCAKLLLNLLDSIINTGTQEAIPVLHSILETFVDKIASVGRLYRDLAKMHSPEFKSVSTASKDSDKGKAKEEGKDERAKGGEDSDKMEVDEQGGKKEEEDLEVDIIAVERSKPIQAAAAIVADASVIPDPFKDLRYLFRSLVFGLKTILVGLKHCGVPGPDAEVVGRMVENGVRCWAVFDHRDGRDEKETMDLFCNVFLLLEPQVFQEVLSAKVAFLFEEMLKNPNLLAIPQFLLSNESSSHRFVGILLRFLVNRLEQLGKSDKKHASITLRLFKMAFMAVTIFPEANEAVLQPHLSRLIMTSMKLASKAEEPTNYYLLLRALFRSIGGGRFELLYKDVLPLLQVLLENLNTLLNNAEPSQREIFVDLCLTVPVRLSVLLPYLGYLMKPLVLALQSSPELVSQGLRTLELCIDNLTQEFLDPIMAPYSYEIMSALWKHLQPLPHNHQHSHTTMRILGKMGGRNRRLLQQPARLTYKDAKEATFTLAFDGRPQSLALAPITDLALTNVRNTNEFYRRKAYELLRHAVALFLEGTLNDAERESLFQKVIRGLFETTHAEELTDEASSYIVDLAKHIFGLELKREASTTPIVRPLTALTMAFLESIAQTLGSLSISRELKATAALVKVIVTNLRDVEIEDEGKQDIPSIVLHHLGQKFASLCYEQSWTRKTGGWMGIRLLTNEVDLGSQWMLERVIEFVRALLFMLKDMPTDPPGNVEEVSQTLLDVIRKAVQVGEDTETPDRQLKRSHLISLLVTELSSSNATVRETTRKALELLGELQGRPVHEMLAPVRDRLLGPIFAKPLRALPFGMQIGHIDAITYCLTLRPPLPEFSDELLRVLHEALALADADDQALLGRTSQYKNTVAVNNLRVVCIKLLSAAMACTDFFGPKQSAPRMQIIGVYFKSLYSRSPEVVQTAYDSLRDVLSHQSKLPKDLLQTGLRPILMNLADHKRLSVSGLEGLARLLELLTNYFKVEIGNKLLDHLRALSEPATLQNATVMSVEENVDVKVMAGIVNIFHLLPPAANCFLNDLVVGVVEIETQLRRTLSTPFTTPLAKYLNRYAAEGVNYFFERIGDRRYLQTFCRVIASEHAASIRAEITSAKERLLLPLLKPEGDRVVQGLLIIKALLEQTPEWTIEHVDVLEALLAIWKSPEGRRRRREERSLPTRQMRESVHLVDIFLTHLRKTPELDLIFQVVDVFTYRNSIDYTHVSRFIFERVARSDDISLKRAAMKKFIDFFEDKDVSQSHKAQILRIIINPMLLATFRTAKLDAKKEALINNELTQALVTRVWRPFLTKQSAQAVCSDDAYRIELLHMSTMIVEHCSDMIVPVRKDVIKFGWMNITAEDITAKNAAYVFIARFLGVFDSPSKIILQVYSGLLRSHQSEGKALARQALDILTPALPQRLASQEGGALVWSKYTRRIMLEDSHNLPQLTNIFHLIVRHPDQFYPCRELFVPHFVNSLNRLGLNPAATSESRSLTISLIELVLKWEKRRLASIAGDSDEETTVRRSPKSSSKDESGSPSRKRVRLDTAGSSAPSVSLSAADTYVPAMAHREIIVSYLLRFVAMSAEPLDKSRHVRRALSALTELLSLSAWSDVTVKLAFFQRTLVQSEVNENTVHMLLNSAEVLNLVVANKSDDWFQAHLPQLHKLLEKSMLSTEPALHDAFQGVLERLFKVAPSSISDEGEEDQDGMRAFLNFADTTISEGLRSLTNLHGAIVLLRSWAVSKPDKVEPFTPSIIKALTKLTKDHLNADSPVPPSDPQLKLLIMVLQLLRDRISLLQEQRRWFLSALVQLVEKSSSVYLCRFILDMMRKLILEQKETFPTVKEKAGILVKMMSFEARGDQSLLNDFLELILSIYTTPDFARTELTVRLENAFLLGCRNPDPKLRSRFLEVFDKTCARSLATRLHYVFGHQSWEFLADSDWLQQALDLLLGSADEDDLLLQEDPSPAWPDTEFGRQLQGYCAKDILQPARALLYTSPEITHRLWVTFFRAAWRCLSRREPRDLTNYFIGTLTKEYHLKQVDRRPNVIQTLLEGALACSPQMELPPHVVKFLGRTFNAWYTSIELLQGLLENLSRDEETIRETALDALAELFAELSEEDMFYGLWRRRCVYTETNVAISYEQNGMWAQAQAVYEAAQTKSRSGVLHFTESEYNVWGDHWVMCAQKLQQWDILNDLAKLEVNTDLFLECAWRLSDWTAERELFEQSLESLAATPTPRRRVFEAYMALVKSQGGAEKASEFSRICDEAVQLSLRKWHGLPTIVTQVHIPLLQIFQQFVELQEAGQIFASLAQTNATNLDQRSQELKNVMQTWRERLPNSWDDIDAWSDLVAWRQHVFGAVNKAYLPLIPMIQNGATGSSTNSYAYRGYHETAWIINRFAHVARKHHLNDVCISSLTKIYTLPNIEIQEAFLKLREQAKCHYQNPNELSAGLDVINNTNLMFFAAPQKAEFFTLKGMFMAKLGLNDDANQAFATAIQMDLNLAKAWMEWGRYNDRIFREKPTEMAYAGNAVSCYLQAAGLYKNSKVYKLLIRILWFLGFDDQAGTVSKAFEGYKGDMPVWYWIAFIPQLLQSLSQREAKYARVILMRIAKTYPQALYFQLRTTKEDFANVRRNQLIMAQQMAARNGGSTANAGQAAGSSPATSSAAATPTPTSAPTAGQPAGSSPPTSSSTGTPTAVPRQPWELVDEILNILKTAFPLLALTMESMVDQIQQRFKAQGDEDMYRLTNALLNDGLQQYVGRALSQNDNGMLAPASAANVARFAENLHPAGLKASSASCSACGHAAFEEDFVKSKPTLRDYVQRLQRWRDRYEAILDRRPRWQPLEHSSHYLVEFQHQKFDEVEVPGQYLKMDDSNADFVKISRILPKYEVVRSGGTCTRRLTILGHKGSTHSFSVQLPAPRYSRREEKNMQMLRILNGVLERRKETRKRSLSFHVPAAIPLAPNIRLMESHSSFVSLQDIYEKHCEELGMSKDDPVIAFTEKLKASFDQSKGRAGLINLRMELMDEISTKMVPDNVLSKFMWRSMASPTDLWLMRKQFTLQMASIIFLTYIFTISNRLPVRLHVSRANGQVFMSDILPSFSPAGPNFASSDSVPFRLTPNVQNFITPVGIEGLLTSSLMALGRSLTEPELYDLEHRLSIFIRDEVMVWFNVNHKQPPEGALRDCTLQAIQQIIQKAQLMSCKLEREKPNGTTPACQSIIDLISRATNPQNLAMQDTLWAPWF